MVSFEELPEDCISNIIRRTSPRDACRASFVSHGFKSAIDSDTIWEQFLPKDYPEILSEVASPVVMFSTKKELYRRLAHSHIIVDGGKMSFSVGKNSGKKSFMLGARQLSIGSSDDPQFWKWTSSPHSRFSEVAELLNARRVNIRGRIQTRLLSPKTTYLAYLVINFSRGYGRESAHVSIMHVNANNIKANECINPQIRFCRSGYRRLLKLHRRRRKDGWLEIELGQFHNDCGDDGEVETRINGIEFDNSGLIVEGIEFRPKDDE